MPRNLLTDREVRNAKPKPNPKPKPYRLCDGEGLFLYVAPTGTKSWQYRYKLNGVGQTLTLGKQSDAQGLAWARDKADEARQLAAKGEHLTTAKRVAKAQRAADNAATFESVTAAWIKSESRSRDGRKGWSETYRDQVAASINNHLGELAPLPIASISAKVAAPHLRKVERETDDMAAKVRARLRAIFDYAIEDGLIDGNPIPMRRRRKGGGDGRPHLPAVVDLPGLGEILRAARAADPCKGIQRAHQLLVGTALRIAEVVGARWSEFELDGVHVPIGDTHRTKLDPAAGNWSVPRDRMKKKDKERGPHVVPLPPALLAALREWRDADAGSSEFVCPAPRDPETHITREAVEGFYRKRLKLARKHSPHSWRSAFSTICRNAGKPGDAVEAQLDHVVGTAVASAYDRATRLEIRRGLMRWYEKQLIAARDGATVTQLRRGA